MGSRNTKQKEAILRVLRKTADHVDVRWIHLQVRHSLPNSSLGILSRNLKARTDEGLISFLGMGSRNRSHGTLANHAPFHCQNCGRVRNVNETSDPSMDNNFSDRYRLSLEFHRLKFFGLCPAFQRASTPPENIKIGAQHD